MNRPTSQPSIEYPLTLQEFNQAQMFERIRSVPFLKAVKTDTDWTVKSTLLTLFPIFTWLPRYNCKADIISDLLCGFTVAVMHVPQGMAYATLARVHPIVGIYMAIFPTIIYVVMGTSKHISLGSFSITCMMSASPITTFSALSENNSTDFTVEFIEEEYKYSPIEVASVLCLSVGMFQFLLGCVKAGYLSVFLSKPIVSGFTTGAAVLVFITQFQYIFGIKVQQYFGPFSAIYTIFELVRRISETNLVAFAMSVSVFCCLIIYSEMIDPWLKWKFKLPMELIVMVCGTLISAKFDLQTKHNVNVVGDVPTGFPALKIPQLQLMIVPQFLLESVAIAIISFAITLSMATIFATKEHYKIDANQELFAYGFGNMFGGLFPCLPIAASLSRSTIQHTSGGKTQLVTVFSSMFLILIICSIADFLHPLPYCVLAGIVIKSLLGMVFQVKRLPTFWRESSSEGVIWILTFLSVILLDIIFALGIALVLAILSIILMNQKTYVCLLGQVPRTNLYLEIQRYQAAKSIPEIMLVQIYAGLHFANINICINRIDYLLKKKTKTEGANVDVVILVFSAVSFIDPEALATLTLYINELDRRGISVGLAGCTGRVYEQMNKCQFFDKFPEDFMFPSVHSAVTYYISKKLKDLPSNILHKTTTIESE